MQRRLPMFVLGVSWIVSFAGCRCCCCFEHYNDFIDDLKNYPILFDTWYNPRLDISRAGKPDWCGPINSQLAPCRCCDQECYDRHDEVWQYPPRYLHQHPSAFYPGPSNAITPPGPIEDTGPRLSLPSERRPAPGIDTDEPVEKSPDQTE